MLLGGDVVLLDTAPAYTVPARFCGTCVDPFASMSVYVTLSPSNHDRYVGVMFCGFENVALMVEPGCGDVLETFSAGNVCTGSAGLVSGHDVMNWAAQRDV
ncbi:hypothetical protein A0H81_03053 [Grifola frondosa]|uniref:Uncharacterized protein n=1 Tax=Grifola frondosa TaxID=5627 RepID=A0A1C7MPS6_GRIFR|nr:hypothetical protein A0H81_03053 [Grifola frondosa]